MSTPGVRAATADDVADIVRIQRRTWQVAYADMLGGEAVAQLDSTEVEQGWAAAVAHPDTVVYLATEVGTVVGYCVAGPAPEDEMATADGSLPADGSTVGLIGDLLVEPRWGRRGHGGRLLVAAATELREGGIERAVVWVAESDSASLAFFRRAGFNPDNTVRTLDTGERTVREIRLTGPVDQELTE